MQLLVDLGERSYPIFIESDAYRSENLSPLVENKKILVVTNETIAPLYLDQLTRQLDSAQVVDTLILPDGEQFKTMDSLNEILTKALSMKLNRKSLMVAIGGGVVGDMTGFAASCYQRGIDFIQVPTTLLSQVDSSVGGKTGVNHALGKNMIGAFHQPKAVCIDTNTLNTLPEREYAAGMAEVIKYGLIYDADFFGWLEENIEQLKARDEDALKKAIYRSCEIKAAIVKEDEKETTGKRAWLNLGHTFGHAIETLSGYGRFLHGEAVAIGTLMALKLSEELSLIDLSVRERTAKLFHTLGLPNTIKGISSVSEFVDVMLLDKKNVNAKIRLILLSKLGEAVLTEDYDGDKMQSVIADFVD
ncbi:MAG: 3-dehydroquinate synthase [Cellvibrionales bacterium]|nr:3-dehydroquinate synthase [Cellvibrionales bacterium]